MAVKISLNKKLSAKHQLDENQIELFTPGKLIVEARAKTIWANNCEIINLFKMHQILAELNNEKKKLTPE